MEAGDLAAVVETFAPDAVLRSPLTDMLTFSGREEIRAVLGVILKIFDGLHYTDELCGAESAVLVAGARVDGIEIEIVDHLRLDESGKIRELTVFFRPLPATAAAMRAIGEGLGPAKESREGSRDLDADATARFDDEGRRQAWRAAGAAYVVMSASPELVVRVATPADAGVVGQLLHDFNTEFDEPTPGPTRLADESGAAARRRPDAVLLGGRRPDGLAVLRFRPSIWSMGWSATWRSYT